MTTSEFNFPTNAFGYVPGTIPAKVVYAPTAPTNPVEALFWMNTAPGDSQGTLSIRTSIVDGIPSWVPLNSEGLLRAQLELLTSTVPVAGAPAKELPQLGFFADGMVLVRKNHLMVASDGQAWFWKGALPKTVAPGSTPASSGGLGVNKWIKLITAFESGNFETGFTATSQNQFFIWPSSIGGDGRNYSWNGVLPKIVPANSSPASTGGVSDTAWSLVDNGADILADELANGTAIIAGKTGTFIVDLLDLLVGAAGADSIGYSAPGSSPVAQSVGDKLDQYFSVLDYGATGSGDESSAFTRAAIAAEAKGVKIIYIPFPTFQVADGTNGRGCVIIGSGTVLTGRINNHAGLVNVVVNGHNQSDKQLSPAPVIDKLPKLIWKDSNNVDYVFLEKASRGYLLAGFRNNSTTSSDSLATGSSDITRRRLSTLQDTVWVGTYVKTPASMSGAGWASSNLSAGTVFGNLIPSNNSGRPLSIWSTSGAGQNITYNCVPHKGYITLAVYSGLASCPVATVAINGGTPINIDTNAAGLNTIKIFKIPVPSVSSEESVSVVITHAGAGGDALNIIGVNFFELKDWEGHDYDNFAYYRNTVAYAEYLTTQSANDLVIQEFNSQIYGVSYHGGETAITDTWTLDDVNLALGLDTFSVGKSLRLLTKANVNWASVGGGSLSIEAKYDFGLGSVSHTAQLKGTNLEVREIYCHMMGLNEAFSEVLYPGYFNLAAAPNGSRSNLGRTDKVIVRHPITGQEYSCQLTLFEREQNRYGGVHFWKSVGSYNKLYYGPVLGGRKVITDFSCTSVHTCR